MAVVVVVSLVSLAVSFTLYTRLGAEVAYILGAIGPAPWQEVADPLKPAIVRELWIRGLVPPPLQRSCYAMDAGGCEQADWMAAGSGGFGDWGSYLLNVAFCLVSSLTTGALALAFTRQEQSSSPKPQDVSDQ